MGGVGGAGSNLLMDDLNRDLMVHFQSDGHHIQYPLLSYQQQRLPSQIKERSTPINSNASFLSRQGTAKSMKRRDVVGEDKK